MKATCLCGAIQIRIGAFTGPFELCHCNKCKKHTGSAFNAVIDTDSAEFAILQGREFITSYKAPLDDAPPNYQVWFCKQCGSPLPNPDPTSDVVEIPAGLIDGSVDSSPDKNVFSEQKLPWIGGISNLQNFTKEQFAAFQNKYGRKRCDSPE